MKILIESPDAAILVRGFLWWRRWARVIRSGGFRFEANGDWVGSELESKILAAYRPTIWHRGAPPELAPARLLEDGNT